MEEKVIKSSSQELFKEVIKTLPFNPKHFEIRLLAQGILLPKYDEKKGKERYLSECLGNNVIPYSKMELKYDFLREAFKIEDVCRNIHQFYPNLSDEEKSAILQGFISGRKIHKINIDSGSINETAFNIFKKQSILEYMLNMGYKLRYGDFWANYWHSNQHYAEGDIRSGGVSFDADHKKSLRLDLDDKVTEKWFDKLSKKYNKS